MSFKTAPNYLVILKLKYFLGNVVIKFGHINQNITKIYRSGFYGVYVKKSL